ncbi:uncharacterized protein LOC141631626 [Silene latifolia]|uniref:uncharacterized protein LOC141631626 n=1 Tax=Silene latifolia TaxID=37657 RepID=UPI003D76C460
MQQFLHDSNMQDMKATGSFYTWTNKHEVGDKVYSRIDRAFINDDWIDQYPRGYASFLPERLFDHCPCVIQFEEQFISRNLPFKYFNMWPMAPDFEQIVKNGWSATVEGTPMFQIVTKLKLLKKDLKALNRDQFSDVENLTHVTELSLKHFQTLLSKDPLNEDLVSAEKECSKELRFLKEVRAKFLNQKSKEKWIKDGDENSAYFHTSITRRRARIRLKEGIVRNGRCLQPHNIANLMAPLTDLEIKTAMYDIPGYKAPGPDGFSSKFYKDRWHITGQSVVNAVRNVYQAGNLLKQSNNTIITLVLKVDIPETLMQYRPIACCNTLYKCISKVICNRLSTILPDIVSPSQGAFIKGRDIVGNIFIYQDLIKMYKRKTYSPRVLMKIDLQKAYDSVEWAFVSDLLMALGFPAQFIKLVSPKRLSVMDCNCIVEKVVGRIRGLGARKLSYAGRLVLIASVLHNLHSYWAQIFIIPKTVINRIDAMCRKFLWHAKETRRFGVEEFTPIEHSSHRQDRDWMSYEPAVSSSWAWRTICHTKSTLKPLFTSGIVTYSIKEGYKWLTPAAKPVNWFPWSDVSSVRVQKQVSARRLVS